MTVTEKLYADKYTKKYLQIVLAYIYGRNEKFPTYKIFNSTLSNFITKYELKQQSQRKKH